MNSSHRHPDVIEDGLDRQNIAVLSQRFMSVNEDRMERMRGELSDRQQLFMDILPLLFHSNHPMLPGFVSRRTPARVARFKPSKRDILVGKMVAKSFTLSYDPSATEDIYGIYIMGSVGTIAQSGHSDFDIWICHRPGLSAELLAELDQKGKKIAAWAAEMRLEVHFFLMDFEAFKARKISQLDKESSGSAQHLLLLDEFYRTAIYVAGRTPIWWFVPPHEERIYRQYTNTLLYKRFIPDDHVLDFGGVGEIPPGEFLGAGVWQLYKAIESPYKSLLKLLLLEAYVADYPNITPLSLNFKESIYEGETDIDQLDAYVMIYQRIEDYLVAKQQPKRLELARRCFYFKINKALSRTSPQLARSWQYQLLARLVADWRWSSEHIAHLDGRLHWKAQDVATESAILIAELNHTYKFLQEFAASCGKQRAIAPDELVVLGRKLQAAYERRPGKIEWVNPNISDDISESFISIAEVENSETGNRVWLAEAHEAGVARSRGTPLKSAANLVELVFWGYFNGVITPNTRIEMQQTPAPIDAQELKRLQQALRDWLPLPLPSVAHDTFKKSAEPEAVLLLVNVGKSPTPDLDHLGYQRMSGKSNALAYGGFEENLVASIDMLVRNSWNEITTRRFEGNGALIDAMLEYLQLALPGTHHTPPRCHIQCVGLSHANTISHRLESWMAAINDCFFSSREAKHRRFVFQLADAYFCLQYRGMKPQVKTFANETHLIDHLEQEQLHYSPVVIDAPTLKNHPVRAVISAARPGALQVFYRRFDIGIEIYVVDERGSILHTMFRGRHNHNPLKPLYHFLRATLYRQAQLYPDLAADFGIYPIQFFEIKRDTKGHYHCQSRQLVSEMAQSGQIQVKAIAHINERNELTYDYYCDEQEFLARDFDRQADLVVSQYILSRRSREDHYPLYISDLDLSLAIDAISPNRQLQIVHYLRIKNRLEARLNQAIGILLNA